MKGYRSGGWRDIGAVSIGNEGMFFGRRTWAGIAAVLWRGAEELTAAGIGM